MKNQAGKTGGFGALIKSVSNLGTLLTNLCMAGMLLIIMTNVTLRYIVGAPLAWGDTAMIFLMIMMVFTGLASIVLAGANIRMTALVDRLSSSKQHVLAAICAAVNVIYFGILVWAGIVKTENSYVTGVYDIATDWVFWPVQAVMTLGLLLALIAAIYVGYNKFVAKAGRNGKEEAADTFDSSTINE